MAENRRQAVRRESIIVEVRGKDFEAKPLPWLQANELGDEVIKQNADSANHAVEMYVKGDIPQLEASLKRNISDWGKLLVLGYRDNKPEDFVDYDTDELHELGKAILEVNHFEYLLPLIDPNSEPPTQTGGNEAAADGDGQKTSSSPDSSSTESIPASSGA